MTWYAAPAPRRRLPAWAKLVLGLVVAAVLGCVLFVAAVAVSLSGGLDDVLDLRKPSEDSREVQRARERAADGADALRDELLAVVPLGDTGVRVARDDCSVGQHNWKIDDPYDLDCSLARTSVHTTAGDPVAEAGAVLDRLLQGWEREATSPTGAAWTRGTAGTPGSQRVSVTLVDPGPLSPSDLGAGYAAADEPSGTTRDGRPYAPERLRADHPGRQLVLVTVSEQYFYE